MLFFNPPKLTLNEIVTFQIDLYPLVPDKKKRKVPFLINDILDRIELLGNSGHTQISKTIKSFFNLKHPCYETEWCSFHEKELASMKSKINSNSFKMSEYSDNRLLVQLMLDFIESLREPAITQKTIILLKKVIDEENEKDDVRQIRFDIKRLTSNSILKLNNIELNVLL